MVTSSTSNHVDSPQFGSRTSVRPGLSLRQMDASRQSRSPLLHLGHSPHNGTEHKTVYTVLPRIQNGRLCLTALIFMYRQPLALVPLRAYLVGRFIIGQWLSQYLRNESGLTMRQCGGRQSQMGRFNRWCQSSSVFRILIEPISVIANQFTSLHMPTKAQHSQATFIHYFVQMLN